MPSEIFSAVVGYTFQRCLGGYVSEVIIILFIFLMYTSEVCALHVVKVVCTLMQHDTYFIEVSLMNILKDRFFNRFYLMYSISTFGNQTASRMFHRLSSTLHVSR